MGAPAMRAEPSTIDKPRFCSTHEVEVMSSRPNIERLCLRVAVAVAALALPNGATAQSQRSMLSHSPSALYAERNLPVTWRSTLPACLSAQASPHVYRSPVFLSYWTNDTTNRLQHSE